MEKLSEPKCVSERKKVLFVDDDKDYLESMKSFLEKRYDVITAFSAEQGRAEMEKGQPDLIILDAMMEPKDGFTFAKELKAHEAYKDIPIVMLTGVVPEMPQTRYSQDQVLRFSGEDFVEKTAGIEELLATVARFLN
ncbi:MAG: response regulator [Planctomycetota bacterium]|jgi:DNA-binding response OmpR family regulator